MKPFLFALLIFFIGVSTAFAVSKPPQNYQKMASEGVTVSSPSFVLVQGVNTLYVRSIRIQLVGLQTDHDWLSGRFTCWFDGNPLVVIDSVQFNAGPNPNGEAQVESFDWPPDYYAKGLPAPTVGDSISCGWEAPGIGQDPPILTTGFARIRMLYKDV